MSRVCAAIKKQSLYKHLEEKEPDPYPDERRAFHDNCLVPLSLINFRLRSTLLGK